MNEQIIAQFENLLNPAAKRYLRRIIAGEVPLVLEPGINPIPEGLDSEQTRVVHQIAQAASAENLNLSRIVNSGVLRSRGGGGNAPTSEVDLYNMLYNVTSGRTLGEAGPPDRTRIEETIQQIRENEPTRQPTGSQKTPSQTLLEQIAARLQSNFAQYLLGPGGFQSNLDLPENQRLSNSEREFLDLVREDPTGLTASDLVPFLRSGNESQDIAALTQILTPVEEAAQPAPATPPPTPAQRQVIAGGEVQPGLVSATRISGGESGFRVGQDGPEVRPASQRTEPTGPVAGPGGEWAYDTLTSQPVFIEEGQPLPSRIDPATYRGPIRESGIEPADEGDGATDTDTDDGAGGVPVVETPYADAVPADWELAASEIYGAYFHIIKQDPIIAELVARAAFEEWEPDKFQYELEQTNWWKTTSANARQFDNEYARDPATVQADIDAYAADLRQSALDLNIRLTNEQLNKLAFDALRGGLKAQQVINALGTLAIGSDEGVTALRYGFYGNKINELAANYGVSISDDEFGQLVNRFAVGQENEDSITSIFQTRATALFPALSERLMAGETFSQIVEPYRYRASQILDQDFAATDFMDNDSFAQAVTYIGDDGKQRPMTYTEWGQYLRSNREFGYEFTEEAQSRAYQVANSIADMFGAI